MYIICHYGEIAIKGNNRDYFEKQIVTNLRKKLSSEVPDSFEYVKKIAGRILVKINDQKIKDESVKQKLTEVVMTIFGITSFSYAKKIPQDLPSLKKNALAELKDTEFSSFRISTKRSNKNYPMTSHEIDVEVGAYVFEKMKDKKVKLKNADVNVQIEIVDQDAYIYTEKIKGPGGMPVGTAGKALVLLSGGIDSPVAAYYAMKRGVRVDYIHFHSVPYTTPESLEKIKDLAKIVNKYQDGSKIYMIPFAETQKQIMMSVPPKLRVIFYRRLMMKIAENIANEKNYLALYTGDSVAQVASQTLENIKAIEQITTLPILRPLIGFDKEEIMDKARDIGTFETSIIPHDDCCSRLMPKHPETRAKMEEVLGAEKNLDVEKIITNCLDNIELHVV